MENTANKDSQVPNKNSREKREDSYILKYPLDLTTVYPHRVDFFIYSSSRSKFKKETVSTPTAPLKNYDGIPGFKGATSFVQNFSFLEAGARTGAAAVEGAVAGGLAFGRSKFGSILGATVGAVGSATTELLGNTQARKAAESGIAAAAIDSVVSSLTIERKAQEIKNMISLYMPANFFTTYSHDYDTTSVREAAGMLGLLGSASASVFGGATDVSTIIDRLQKLPGSSNPYSALLAGALGTAAQTPIIGGSLVGSGFADVALFNMGYAQNPMLEVLYRGTQFRQFQFEFMFQPRNKQESDAVRKIIKTFKFHAAPETVPLNDNPSDATTEITDWGPMFFTPPSEFAIEFKYSADKKNTFLPEIGRCVLSRIDVDYSPGGQWSTFADGVPIETRMRLDFTEVELVTKDKIGSDLTEEGGY
jgi:hypothetical protein